ISLNEKNPLDRVKAALAAVPGGGFEELEVEWSHLQTQSTYRQLLAVVGVSANALAWSGLEFTCADKRLGPDPAAFHAAYKLARHRTATRDEAFGQEDGFAVFNYDALCQHLSSATARITGPKWGPLLVGLAAYLPETVVDTALRTNLKEALFTSIGGVEKFNPKSDLLLWTFITKEASKKDYNADVLNGYFTRWTNALKILYDRLVSCWHDYQETEAPRDNNIVLLLGQWASLRFRKIPLSRAFSEERRLAAKIAAIGDDGLNQDCAVKLDFKVRRKNLALIVRSCKAAAEHNGVLELARLIETRAKSDTECTTLVQEYARANGFSDFDRLFGTERFDFTRDDPNGTKDNQKSHRGEKRHRSQQDHGHDKRPKHGHDGKPISSSPSAEESRNNGRDGEHKRRVAPGTATSPSKPSSASTTASTGSAQSAKPTLAEKLKVSSSVLQQRRQAGACLGCGSMEHKLADCPKYGSSKKSDQDRSSTVNVSKTSETSAYFVSVAQSVAGADKVWRMTTMVSPPDELDQQFSVRVGIDSYSACSLVTRLVVDHLQLKVKKLQHPSTLILADGSTIAMDSIVFLRLNHGGYSPVIRCFITDSLPEADVLLGYPDFPSIGIQISVPSASGINEGGISASIDTQVESALFYLTSNIDKWKACPGAPDYRFRLRRLEPWEVKDTSVQTVTLEVEVLPRGPQASNVADAMKSKGNTSTPFDYSIGLYKALSEQARSDYCLEIKNFVDSHWWVPIDQNDHTHSLVSETDIITFPSCQKETKSTRVRACSDARRLNSELARASYNGWSIDQILRLVRARWDPASSSMFILDLRKAFYKIRIAHNKFVRVRTLGRVFVSNRIIFGIRIGPAILSAQVCTLCNAVLTGMLGRPVEVHEVFGLADVISGLTILPYYDDLLVIGPTDLARRFVEIISRIAPQIGAEFPIEKQSQLGLGTAVNHLGVTLSMSNAKELLVSCNSPPVSSVVIGPFISKRSIFSAAGAIYDPAYCHAESRLIADHLRSWAGKWKCSWDKQLRLAEPQLDSLRSLIDRAKEGFSNCAHGAIPAEHLYLIGYTDASDKGGGCCLISSRTAEGRPHDNDVVPLEEHARLFDEKQQRWHVNRKEFYWLHRTIRYLVNWAKAFPPSSHNIRGIIVYCDNTAATAWGSADKPHKYDIQAVHRLQDDISDLLSQCQEKLGIPACIRHIAGYLNGEADKLSRLGNSLAVLPAFSDIPADANGKANIVNALPSCVVFTHDRDCALITPPLRHVDPERMLPVIDPVISIVDTELFPVAAAHVGATQCDDLTGIADMSEADLLEHCRQVLDDEDITNNLKLFGVPVSDLLASFADPDAYPTATRLRLGGATTGPRFRFSEGLLKYKDKQTGGPWLVYLPSTRSRAWALYRYHGNPLLGGHRGSPRAIAAAKADGYWWPTMAKDMNRWIKHCPNCQLGKWYEPYNPQPLVFRRGMTRFSALQLDFMGPMDSFADSNQPPCPGGNMYVMVMIDEGSRAVLSLLVPTTSALIVIMGLLIWFQAYGIPDYVQLDGAGAHVSRKLRVSSKV
ncbi:hypothetical protein FOZ61_001042, partial [Perkinsus olseni]